MVDTQLSAKRNDAGAIGNAYASERQGAAARSVEDIEGLVSRLREGLSTLSLTSRYTRDELDTIYALGWSHLSRGQADTALRLFLFLTDYAPTAPTYLTGLGVCLQQCDRYEEALTVFSWVGTLDGENVEATLRSAECLLALKDRTEAERLLDLIVTDSMVSSGKRTHVAYRAQALLDVLRRGIEGNGASSVSGRRTANAAVDSGPVSAPF